MIIRIKPTELTVNKNSFSEIEKDMFENIGPFLPSGVRLFEHEYTWTISSTKERLFDTLIILSSRFDIEII